jgi:hypothetical protein
VKEQYDQAIIDLPKAIEFDPNDLRVKGWREFLRRLRREIYARYRRYALNRKYIL